MRFTPFSECLVLLSSASEYVGCFKDGGSESLRAMVHKETDYVSMTIDYCISRCIVLGRPKKPTPLPDRSPHRIDINDCIWQPLVTITSSDVKKPWFEKGRDGTGYRRIKWGVVYEIM